MLQIIFVLVGLYILIKGRINFSREKELVRPESTYIGGILLLLAFILFIFFTPIVDLIIGSIFFIMIFISSYFLSRNAMGENIIKKYSSLTTLWSLLFILSLFISPFAVFIFDDPSSSDSLMANILFISLFTAPVSFIIGAVVGYFNRKKDRDNVLVYLPLVNIFIFIVALLFSTFYCGGQIAC